MAEAAAGTAGEKRSTRSDEFMAQAMAAHGGAVYVAALGLTRSHADAQDVAQDVFLRLLTDGTEFNDADHLRAWLLRVTVNRCRELWRTPWARRVDAVDAAELTLADPAPTPEEAAVQALEESPVWAALQALAPKFREVALLYYVEELPSERIARIVGASPATVRTRLHRARMQMKKTLGEEEL